MCKLCVAAVEQRVRRLCRAELGARQGCWVQILVADRDEILNPACARCGPLWLVILVDPKGILQLELPVLHHCLCIISDFLFGCIQQAFVYIIRAHFEGLPNHSAAVGTAQRIQQALVYIIRGHFEGLPNRSK